jgi:alkylation response protein AidB-like acyl-CoA dehydrogenase
VSKEYTIGPVNQGYACFSQAIAEERLLIAVGAVGFAGACLARLKADYEREALPASGRKIFDAEAEDILMHMEASEAYLSQQIGRLAGGQPVDKMGTCMAKFAICEQMYTLIRRCLSCYGPLQFEEGTWVSRAIRDARVLTIFAGTSETMQDIYGHAIIRETKLNDYRK